MRRAAWGLCGTTIALALGRFALGVADPEASSRAGGPQVLDSPLPLAGFDALVLGTMAVLAAVIVVRRPHNPIGWILSAVPLSLSVVLLAAHLYESLAGSGHADAAQLAAWVTSWAWVPAMVSALVLFPLLFPTGRPPTPRWRPLVWAAGPAGLLLLVGTALTPGRLEDVPIDNPFGAGPVAELAGIVGFALLVVSGLGALASMIVRFRRSRGVEREQMKWVTAAAVLFVFLFAFPSDELIGEDVGFASLLVGLLAVFLAVAVAMVRYRLYDIDRLISATLVYGALTVTLGAAFAVTVLGLGVVVGGGSTVATAVATLGVTLAFRPLRERVQATVDRRFNRARYEGRRRVDAFLGELREGRAEPERVGEVLGGAVGDPELRLLFWLPSEDSHADERGQVSDLPAHPGGRTPVRRGELLLGTVVHDPAEAEGPLLDELILRAGLAIEIARLRVEVRRQLAEVEASRARIVSATYQERRRLERDLHDGAQQRLVSIGLELRQAQRHLGPAGTGASAELDGMVVELTETIDQLRALSGKALSQVGWLPR